MAQQRLWRKDKEGHIPPKRHLLHETPPDMFLYLRRMYKPLLAREITLQLSQKLVHQCLQVELIIQHISIIDTSEFLLSQAALQANIQATPHPSSRTATLMMIRLHNYNVVWRKLDSRILGMHLLYYDRTV